MILCPNCGANPRFDIASQKMLCPFCGTYSEPTDERYTGSGGADMQTVTGDYAGQPDMMQVKIYTCGQCGAELMTTDSDATAFCSYCGTHQVLQERLDVKKRPDHIIPFKITKEQCKEIYGRKMKKMIFAPKALRDPQYIDEFRGIYMPYWFYRFGQHGELTFKGKKEHRSGNYRIVEHYKLSVDADNTYSGISHDASTSFDDNISEGLAPYNTRESENFLTSYLSGFYADIPDTDPHTYERESALVAARDAYDEAMRTPGFGEYDLSGNSEGNLVNSTHTVTEKISNAMFPVWFLAYRNRDRVAYATINGQTGKMNADIPIDGRRYLIGSAILTVILWGLVEIFKISWLRGILMTVLAGAVLGGLLLWMVLDKMSTREAIRDWERHQSADGRNVVPSGKGNQDPAAQNQPGSAQPAKAQGSSSKKKKKSTSKKLSKPKDDGIGLGVVFIAFAVFMAVAAVTTFLGYSIVMLAIPIVLGFLLIVSLPDRPQVKYVRGKISSIALCAAMELSILVWIINPYKDPVYYFCCLLMTGCFVWSFFDVMYYYNQLMTRPLPQFNKHGGDDRA